MTLARCCRPEYRFKPSRFVWDLCPSLRIHVRLEGLLTQGLEGKLEDFLRSCRCLDRNKYSLLRIIVRQRPSTLLVSPHSGANRLRSIVIPLHEPPVTPIARA